MEKETRKRKTKEKNVGNEKTNSKEIKHQESVKNGTNKEWGRRKEGKNKRWNTEEGRVQKTKTKFHLEKLTTEIFEFSAKKKTDTKMMKNKVKEEVWKEKWDQEQKRRIMR